MNRAPPEMTVSMTPDELRSRLGRIGIWMPPPGWIAADPAELAAAIERTGFTSVWIGGGNATADAFELLKPLLAGTEKLIVATGIANIWAWQPAQMRSDAAALAAQFPGRFILGLGVSHEPLVTSLGHVYERPLEKMEKFLDELDHPAHHMLEAKQGELPPIVLAALGPRMLTLAAERTAGAHPYFTPPEHTAFARSVLGKSALLVPEQALSLAAETPDGLAAGRAYAARYLRMPNYTRNLQRFGFGPDDLADGGSDRLISAIIPSGASAVAERVREHLDAGADHVVLQPLDASGAFAVGQLDDLASAVAKLSQSLRDRAHDAAAYRTPVTSYRWCTGSWTRYLPNVSMVNAAPSLRRPGRCHVSPLTVANRSASGAAAAVSSAATFPGSCSPYLSVTAVSS
jgi:probable F420-dependent oxidoreductase